MGSQVSEKRAPCRAQDDDGSVVPAAPPHWAHADTDTHTHTRRGRAAVVHSYGMFRSGYTPSSWIPWRPNMRKDTPVYREMPHTWYVSLYCTLNTSMYFRDKHLCVSPLWQRGIEHIYTDNTKLAVIPRIRGSQTLWRLKSFRLKISHDIGYAALCVGL